MAKKYVEYEVYVVNAWGSDLVVKDTLEEAVKVAKEWSHETTDEVIVEKVEHEIVATITQPKSIEKSKLHFIGHLRGFSQYEVINDEDMKLALLLESGGKYYLSFATDEEHYNNNIAHRIGAFYGKEGLKALGSPIEVINDD